MSFHLSSLSSLAISLLAISQTEADLPSLLSSLTPQSVIVPSQLPRHFPRALPYPRLSTHSDLHRFLADSLEYRSRLSEIRDGVLGVERRRKGMWKVVRTVGQDWMDEESEAQAAER